MQLKRLKATTLGSQKLILKMHYSTGRKNWELKIWKSGLKNTISNPANLVEGVADKNWIRGGLPSRELSKEGNKQ